MTMPIFFQRYRNGEAIPFKRADLLNILGPSAVINDTAIVAIEFSDTDGGEILGADGDEFEQLSVDDGAGEKFFDALWRIADATGAFIYWLGEGDCSAVTREDILPHLPADIVADVGPVKVVGSGEELENAASGGFPLFEE